jgi:hypothetical protein
MRIQRFDPALLRSPSGRGRFASQSSLYPGLGIRSPKASPLLRYSHDPTHDLGQLGLPADCAPPGHTFTTF